MKSGNYIFELTVWILAFAGLALSSPGDHHFTLCPLALLGLSWCPGCGLGRAVACILHGDFLQSFHYHWLGFPAIFILTIRILQLSKKTLVYFANKPE